MLEQFRSRRIAPRATTTPLPTALSTAMLWYGQPSFNEGLNKLLLIRQIAAAHFQGSEVTTFTAEGSVVLHEFHG
jgi:hypothetical protein